MQRRLNKKLSESARKGRDREEERGRQEDTRSTSQIRRDPDNQSVQRRTSSRGRTRSGASQGRREVREDNDDDENDEDEERRNEVREDLLDPLPLDDREFEEEFGEELLEKAFRDAERGSQRDLPSRRSRSRDVEMKFVNQRSGAYFPGLNEGEERSKSRSLSRSASIKPPGILRRSQDEDDPYAEEETYDKDDEEVIVSKQRTRSKAFVPVAPLHEDDDWEDEAPSPPPIIVPPPRSKSRATPRKSCSRNEGRNESKEALRTRSSNSIVFDSKTKLNSGKNRSSRSNLRSSSKNSLGRRESSRKVSEDLIGSESVTNEIDIGYSRSNPRINSSSRNSFGSRSSSRDVNALPIEIPDSVTDEAAFRRYLSRNSYESVGGGRLPAAMALKNAESNRKGACLCFAIMSIALLSASTCQLRYVVAYSAAHKYPVLNYFLISISIIIEIVTGIGYVVLARFQIPEARVDFINGFFVAGLFVVAISNVVIAAFAFDDHICEQFFLAKLKEMGSSGVDVIEQSPT